METFENHWLVVKIHCLKATGKLENPENEKNCLRNQ